MRFRHWIESAFTTRKGSEEDQMTNRWIMQAKKSMGLSPTASAQDLDAKIQGPDLDPTALGMIQKDINFQKSVKNLEEQTVQVESWNNKIGKLIEETINTLNKQEAVDGTIAYWPDDVIDNARTRYHSLDSPNEVADTRTQVAMIKEAHDINVKSYFRLLDIWKQTWPEKWQQERKQTLGLNFPEEFSDIGPRIFEAYQNSLANFQMVLGIQKNLGIDSTSELDPESALD